MPNANKSLAVSVIRRLHSAGHEALLAGGCVRDMLLGIRPADYDVATSATPDQVARLFRRVLMVGAKFGVAMVIQRGCKIEVTTFRSDASYSDGRRPDHVEFTTPEHDAQRRDFTINGMFYDPLADKVVDFVGGQRDLKAGVIRAIGEPELRFGEDYLRMLRAVRFAARFDFPIEPATAAAVARWSARLADISGERIRDELEKILARDRAAGAVAQLAELGLLRAMLPELYEVPERLPAALRRIEAVAPCRDVLLSMAALSLDLPEAAIQAVTRRWGASNQVRDSLVWMAHHRDDWGTLADGSLADLKRVLARPEYPRLGRLWELEERAATGHIAGVRAIARRARAIDPAQIAPAPLLTGTDLKRLGLTEGRALGRVLNAVYEAQLNEEVATHEQALHLARQFVQG